MVVVGLGNPTEEYEGTRHNVGRALVSSYGAIREFPEFVKSAKHAGHISRSEINGKKVILLLPDTYMNKSGSSVKTIIASKKAAEKLVVVYDDIDLPLGAVRLSFGRGSGGHRGIESVIRAVKTKDFIRVRVGVSPRTQKGVAKKPKGEKAVVDFILGKFRKPEAVILKKVEKHVHEAIDMISDGGYAAALNEFNSR